jgi:hypothetical protein
MSDADLTGRSEFQTELAKARYLRSSFSSIRFWPLCLFPKFKITLKSYRRQFSQLSLYDGSHLLWPVIMLI